MKMPIILLCMIFCFSQLRINAQGKQPDSTKQSSENKPKPLYGGNFGLGYRILTSNHQNYFSNPISFPVTVEAHFNKFIVAVSFDDATGNAESSIDFGDTIIWKRGRTSFYHTHSANFGLFPVNTKRLKVATMVGYMRNSISTKYNLFRISNDYDVVQHGIKISGFIDLKQHRKSKRGKADKYTDYWAIRLSFGTYIPLNKTVYPQYYNGNSFYFPIGFTELFSGKDAEEKQNIIKTIRNILH